ncbi:MAG: RNA pseudouridine synthase [Clostridia bacterium]|nr:RNA pseudouridine synthase [Clostridia bacterium]
MKIIFEDENIVVCIKPIGVDSEHGMIDALKQMIDGEFFALHRLDKAVSGVMVFARNKRTAAELSRVIQNGDMVKEYVAKVHGNPPEKDILEDLLFKDSKKNKVFVVKRERRGVKRAKLEYKVLSYDESANASVVRVRLYTGRTHQIRVQFASRGFSLVGDHKYGARDNEKHPMLYSCCISFPYKDETKIFENLPEWAKGVQND